MASPNAPMPGRITTSAATTSSRREVMAALIPACAHAFLTLKRLPIP